MWGEVQEERASKSTDVMTESELEARVGNRVYLTLLTNVQYLEGCLTLWYALKRVDSKYPLVVMYTESLGAEALEELEKRKIYHFKVEHLEAGRYFEEDTRFNECWTKLQMFSMTEFERIVFLDADMAVVQNMDELFDIPLNRKDRIYGASHACVCNPYKKPTYPSDWVPKNCAFSPHHYRSIKAPADMENTQHIYGPSCQTGLATINSGLVVVYPHPETFKEIFEKLKDKNATEKYRFPDQDLMADVGRNRWVGLSYKYNALKTLRNIHSDLWKDDEVKNIHYIMSPKPWDFPTRNEAEANDPTGTFSHYWDIYEDRVKYERKLGLIE